MGRCNRGSKDPGEGRQRRGVSVILLFPTVLTFIPGPRTLHVKMSKSVTTAIFSGHGFPHFKTSLTIPLTDGSTTKIPDVYAKRRTMRAHGK